jgi:hypothetical protein
VLKREKMAYDPSVITDAWMFVQKAQNITLLSHWKPDFDGRAACNAMAIFLKRLKKA